MYEEKDVAILHDTWPAQAVARVLIEGRLESNMVGRLPSSLLPGSPPPSPTPAANSDPSVPSSPQATPHIHVPPVERKVFEEYQALRKNDKLAERVILTLVYI
jgi:hypothetical protein